MNKNIETEARRDVTSASCSVLTGAIAVISGHLSDQEQCWRQNPGNGLHGIMTVACHVMCGRSPVTWLVSLPKKGGRYPSRIVQPGSDVDIDRENDLYSCPTAARHAPLVTWLSLCARAFHLISERWFSSSVCLTSGVWRIEFIAHKLVFPQSTV